MLATAGTAPAAAQSSLNKMSESLRLTTIKLLFVLTFYNLLVYDYWKSKAGKSGKYDLTELEAFSSIPGIQAWPFAAIK